jgi:hypothetical protein
MVICSLNERLSPEVKKLPLMLLQPVFPWNFFVVRSKMIVGIFPVAVSEGSRGCSCHAPSSVICFTVSAIIEDAVSVVVCVLSAGELHTADNSIIAKQNV